MVPHEIAAPLDGNPNVIVFAGDEPIPLESDSVKVWGMYMVAADQPDGDVWAVVQPHGGGDERAFPALLIKRRDRSVTPIGFTNGTDAVWVTETGFICLVNYPGNNWTRNHDVLPVPEFLRPTSQGFAWVEPDGEAHFMLPTEGPTFHGVKLMRHRRNGDCSVGLTHAHGVVAYRYSEDRLYRVCGDTPGGYGPHVQERADGTYHVIVAYGGVFSGHVWEPLNLVPTPVTPVPIPNPGAPPEPEPDPMPDYSADFAALNRKLDKIIRLLEATAPSQPQPEPGPPPTSVPSPLDFSEVEWLHHDVGDWPETSRLNEVEFERAAGGVKTIKFPHSKAGHWPVVENGEGNVWVFAHVNGQWYAATWEWLRAGQVEKRGKDFVWDSPESGIGASHEEGATQDMGAAVRRTRRFHGVHARAQWSRGAGA